MTRSLIIGLAVLPGTGVVFIPGLLLWVFAGTPWAHMPRGLLSPLFVLGLLLLACGILLAVSTVRLFIRHGNGTPAPWAPPQSLVIRGPYCHVRNPMITGVFLILAGEALLLGSWPIFGWLLAFLTLNLVYMPAVEEPDLLRRFGDPYRVYCANVPRWVLRLRAWNPPAPPT